MSTTLLAAAALLGSILGTAMAVAGSAAVTRSRRLAAREVDGALEVLRAAGWKIRHDREYGVLSGDLLVMTWDAPGEAQHYERTVAQMPWRAGSTEPAIGSLPSSAETPATESAK